MIFWNYNYYQPGARDPRPEAHAQGNRRVFLIENNSTALRSRLRNYQRVWGACPPGYTSRAFSSHMGSGVESHEAIDCALGGDHPIYADVKLLFRGRNPGLSITAQHESPLSSIAIRGYVTTTYEIKGSPVNSPTPGSSGFYRTRVDVGIPVSEWDFSTMPPVPWYLEPNTYPPTSRRVVWAPKEPTFFTNGVRLWRQIAPSWALTGEMRDKYGYANHGAAYDYWRSGNHPVNTWFWFCVVSQPPKVVDGQVFNVYKGWPVKLPVRLEEPFRKIPETIQLTDFPDLGLGLEFNTQPQEIDLGGLSAPSQTEPTLSGTVRFGVNAGTYTGNILATNPTGSTTTPVTINVLNPPPNYFAVGGEIASHIYLGNRPVDEVFFRQINRLTVDKIYPY